MASGVNASLRDYIVERMAVYDSEVDTSEGSEFDQTVIVPLLNRLGPDTTETDAEMIIIDRLHEHDSAISTEVGSGIRDGLITPLGAILEPFRRAVNLVLLRGSWENAESLTEEEANILAENVFYYRDEGEKSYGTLRLKFASPRDVSVTLENIAYAGNLRFVPTSPQSISRLEMTSQVTGSYYYFDITMVSEKAGEEYNVTAGSISSIDGLTGVVGVQQISDFRDGRARQSNLELKAAAQESIVVRNLVTEKSILTILPDANHFPGIAAILVVGRADAALTRDLVWGVASIGGIPQGIRGTSAPDILDGDKFHMGGFTDVWVAPSASTSDVSESIDIENLSDKGELVFASTTGSVNGGDPDRLEDIRAFFSETDEGFLPVQEGDIVLVEGKIDSGEHIEYTVSAGGVGDKYLDVDDNITTAGSNLSDLSYEIRRKLDGYLQISPDVLVAEDSNGDPITNASGDPYLPVPGPTKESEGVLAAANKGTGNISLPLYYISRVEFLSTLDDQPTGVVVPEADPIVIYISDRVAEDLVWIRVVYRHPTRFLTEKYHKFYSLDEATYYEPLSLSGSATAEDTDAIKITGVDKDNDPFTASYPSRKPQVGDLLATYNSATPTAVIDQAVIVAVNYDAGGGADAETYQTERDIDFTGANSARITQGTRKAEMTDEDDFGFTYFEFIAERTSGSQLEIGSTLASPTNGLNSQGWRILPRLAGYSFSTHEDLILRITDYVNDSTPMDGESIRITYMTTPLLVEIQDFLDQDIERVPSEDMLIRRMPPARVHVALTFYPDSVTSAPSEAESDSGLTDYIQASISSTLASYGSATALSNVVEQLGAQKVTYPFSTIVEYAGHVRSGQNGYGKLMSFHGYDGFIVPSPVSTAITSLYRMAQFTPGTIETTEESSS